MAISLTSSGVVYTGTQSPGQDAGTGQAYTLDDYEEGIWTPSLTASSLGDISYTWQTATYTKIGRWVNTVGYVQLSGSGNTVGSGNIGVSGWPFISFTASGYENGSGIVSWFNVFINNAPQLIAMNTGAATAGAKMWATDVAIDGADISKMQNSAQIGWTVPYATG